MYVAQQERVHPVPPPLSMDRLPPQRTASYPIPQTSVGPGSSVAQTPRSPNMPTLSTSTVENGRIYSLDVVQQPIRARMCGFGDKDRRPITPPPCIRLIVIDANTNKLIDINEIDTSFFILTVDLWSADALKEVNLVRHSATSPSISAATSSSYPPPSLTPPSFPSGPPMTQVHFGLVNQYAQQSQYPQQQQSQYAHPPDPYQQHPQHTYQHPSNPYQQNPLPPPPPSTQSFYTTASGTPITPTHFYQNTTGPITAILTSPTSQAPNLNDPRAAPSGMFTRNLIGSLCVSAFKLTDPDGVMGVWFILQDLSVRTEGNFRLKMNFVNVGSPTSPQSLNNGSAPVLASCFSNVFQVFSAKRFPGVIESTSLSKCFATQGIKIPIRKDGPRVGGRGGADDEEE